MCVFARSAIATQTTAALEVFSLSLAELVTFVFQVKAGVGDGTVAAERQVHGVGAALDSLGQLAVLEATNQRAVAIRAVVDVQEVVVWLNVEAGRMEGGKKNVLELLKRLIHFCPGNVRSADKAKSLIDFCGP